MGRFDAQPAGNWLPSYFHSSTISRWAFFIFASSLDGHSLRRVLDITSRSWAYFYGGFSMQYLPSPTSIASCHLHDDTRRQHLSSAFPPILHRRAFGKTQRQSHAIPYPISRTASCYLHSSAHLSFLSLGHRLSFHLPMTPKRSTRRTCRRRAVGLYRIAHVWEPGFVLANMITDLSVSPAAPTTAGVCANFSTCPPHWETSSCEYSGWSP